MLKSEYCITEPDMNIFLEKISVPDTLIDEETQNGRTPRVVHPDDDAVATFGTRGSCRAAEQIHIPPTLRRVGRDGPLSHLFWVQRQGDRFRLEPYCLASPAAPGRAGVRSGRSADLIENEPLRSPAEDGLPRRPGRRDIRACSVDVGIPIAVQVLPLAFLGESDELETSLSVLANGSLSSGRLYRLASIIKR